MGFFYAEGGETLEQVAQRGGGCPIPGNIQAQLSKVIPLKVALLVAGGLDSITCKGPFQPQTFHDPVFHSALAMRLGSQRF